MCEHCEELRMAREGNLGILGATNLWNQSECRPSEVVEKKIIIEREVG